jgi:hypothetical protein
MILNVITLIIIIFAAISLGKEIGNYNSGNKIISAKRRIYISICLIIEASIIYIGSINIFNIEKKHELILWTFALLLMIPIIWLAWIDLKSNLFEIEKNAIEEMKKIIGDIKKDVKDEKKLHN